SVLILGSLLFGYLAVSNFAEEIRYSLEGRRAVAQAEKYVAGKKGTGRAEFSYEMDGQKVKATMITTWLTAPNPGDQVPILYLPDKPHVVHADSFWRRYLSVSSFLALAGLMLVLGLWPIIRRVHSGPASGDTSSSTGTIDSNTPKDTGTLPQPKSESA